MEFGCQIGIQNATRKSEFTQGVSDTVDFEEAVVEWFNPAQDKRYGFLRATDGASIFFHFSDGRFILADGNEPKYADATLVRGGKTFHLRDPQKDDVIVINRVRRPKGLAAVPWGHKSHLNRAREQIAKRPTYRCLHTMGAWGQKDVVPTVVWEGKDLQEVSRKYPIPTGRRSPSADPLISFYSHDDGFEIRHWWEKKTGDGEWERCEDPRQLSGVLRTFERINWR